MSFIYPSVCTSNSTVSCSLATQDSKSAAARCVTSVVVTQLKFLQVGVQDPSNVT